MKLTLVVPYQGRDEGITFEHEHSIYVGVPSHELDNAWAKLLRSRYFLKHDFDYGS